jgi:hypothetical protein
MGRILPTSTFIPWTSRLMEVIIGISGAATVATLLVAMFKFGVPSAPSKAIAGVAFLSGQVSALAVQAAGDGVAFNQKVIATMFITGVLSAAASMGIRAVDQAAEAKRTGSDVQAQREVVADLGAKREKETLNE